MHREANKSKNMNTSTYSHPEGVRVFCKLCILPAILGITWVVYYLSDKGVSARTQEVQRNLLPISLCFLNCFGAHASFHPNSMEQLPLRAEPGSLHSTGASSSWGGVPISIKKLPPFAFSQMLSPSLPLPKRGGASISNIKLGMAHKFSQQRKVSGAHTKEKVHKNLGKTENISVSQFEKLIKVLGLF